jgi:O-antigen ligase
VFYPLYFVSPDFDIAHAHNEFLQAALDLGLPGLIAFLAVYIIAFWMLREIWRAAPSPLPTRMLALGLGGGLFAHVIYGLTDAVALGAKPGVLFWMLLGLITALFLQTQAATRPAASAT